MESSRESGRKVETLSRGGFDSFDKQPAPGAYKRGFLFWLFSLPGGTTGPSSMMESELSRLPSPGNGTLMSGK